MAIKRSADVRASPPRPRTAKRILTTESPPPPPPYLPSEVIFGILSWLPSRSVLRFRCVCKAWQAMLSDPVFITAHHECSKKIRPSLLMVPCAYDREDLHTNENDSAFRMSFYRYRVGDVEELVHQEELPGGISLWSSPLHCDGLILISTMRQQLVVCNPATRDTKRKHYTFTFPRVGFGFDPRSKKYKVARFFYEENLPNSKKYRLVCRFEVLTLGTDSWRQTADPPHWIVGQTPVHVKGYIYWKCVLNQGRMNPSNSFVRFSLADEEFSMVPQSTPSVRFQACPLRGVGGRAVLRLLGLPKPRARGLDLELWGRAEARMESTLGNGDPSS
ncbi:putative F-box protein At3g17500 [Aegilops tauschii subsp. strangulata]|uniref:putative F-box protein At3g17500 n=1 Tax=Aegilops tauschii subsp. strangulata TaxID=200361 RepID=UPI00098A1EB8|nr:putative F-box protein At3g17500 [Aegilops tauschii subsp. strangulata]